LNPKNSLKPDRLTLPLRFALGIALIVALSLWAFYWLMHPPMNDLGLMALFLSITAVISALVSYAAYHLGWMSRSPSIRWTLMGVYLLSSALTFLNVWLTARLMFASQHDLLLATVLLLFAGGIAAAIGYFFSSALTRRVARLEEAAQAIAEGDLETRLPVEGRDEIASLACTFNEMAAQLQSAAQQQQQAEIMRRDLIAWVSHDLQTPLASIRAIVEALADGVVDDPATVQRYLRTAQRDTGALSQLIDDLFQMAQLDAGGLPLNAPGSMTDLISDTLESFSELARSQGIDLQGSVAPGIDPVYMDMRHVGRALNNLIGNALRHTPGGGRVAVRAALQGAQVQGVVAHTGEGIQPDDRPYVFERFYRGKSPQPATGGAGLGLAITRGIILAHGVRNQGGKHAGEGTRFIFVLPKGQE
jgi:signal transduction histidine kinase